MYAAIRLLLATGREGERTATGEFPPAPAPETRWRERGLTEETLLVADVGPHHQ